MGVTIEPSGTPTDVGMIVAVKGAPLATFTLSVSKSGTGSGTVTSDPAGINCGSTCGADFPGGTSVTLTATPGTGATFTGWSGGGCSGTGTCTVTMDAAKSVEATFTLNSYLLSVAKAGSADGTVSSSPGGISCGGDCSESYAHGTSVTLTATPAAGATFKEWRGACTGATCSLTVTGVTTVTAVFSKVFTDATLTPRTTLVKALHVSELREAVNSLRSRVGLGAFAWTDPTLTVRSSAVKAVHLSELRTALTQAYLAPGCTRPACAAPPSYTDPTLTARVTPIKATHVNELRTAVRALE
jgi:hypothetical protein